MTDTLQIALIVVLAVFAISFVALTFFAIQVLFLIRTILKDIRFASSTLKIANQGVQSLGISVIDALIRFLKRR